MQAGHITESQLVIHILEERLDKPPEIRGLAIINRGCAELLKGMETIIIALGHLKEITRFQDNWWSKKLVLWAPG